MLGSWAAGISSSERLFNGVGSGPSRRPSRRSFKTFPSFSVNSAWAGMRTTVLDIWDVISFAGKHWLNLLSNKRLLQTSGGTCAPPGGISKTPVFLCQLPVNWDVGSAGRILKRSGLENVALNVSDPEFPDALNSSLGFDCDVYRKHVSVLYCKLFFCFVL